jgi:hypothetical protein
MTPIDRNPDIDISTEDIPRGMTLVVGKNLMRTARSKNIPFGVASELADVNYQRKHKTRITVGLIIRDHDLERFEAARVGKTLKTGRAE